ncbi:hypothetical protein tb265_38760 [Gemmatimonadetes bacterium T265]|nr:hypothetical protein tb265_38760 [Gemmatimonadetes bacterium T265]
MSTARERPAPTARGRARTAFLVVAVAAVAWFLVRHVAGQWGAYRAVALALRPRWPLVVGASALVLGTYALLIQSWRALVTGWGGRLAYWTGVRIWTVSNLARYVPGTLWSIGAMGLLAENAGVPPGAAAGAAILNTLLNLAAGCVVLAVAGGDYVARVIPGIAHPRLLGAIVGVAGAVALPVALPLLTALAARVLRRDRPAPLPFRNVVGAFVANLVAWVAYGLAFGWFARGMLPSIGRNWAGYVAVFTGSYLTGFLALLAPGGLFVREAAMVVALTTTGMASRTDAEVLAIAQRLWLTVLEIIPGLTFLAAGALRSRRAARHARE